MRCLYQNTPDRKMILGPHTEDRNVFVMCGFCGSGFQFAPAIAMYMSHLLLEGADAASNEQLAHIRDVNDLFQSMEAEFRASRFL